MPHLQLDINRSLDEPVRRTVTAALQALFARVMATGTGHIAVSLREYPTHALALGRVSEPADGIALINADLRAGRSLTQRRDLAVGFIALMGEHLAVPAEHVYVTFTQHQGEDFHLSEGYLGDWQSGEGDPVTG